MTKAKTRPSRKDLQSYIDSGKTKSWIAKEWNTSIPSVNRWLKMDGIILQKHHGRRYYKSDLEFTRDLELLKSYSHIQNTSELARLTNIPRQIINKFRSDGHINVSTKFDLWKKTFDDILSNFDFFVEENKTKSLKIIAEEQNISIEQLKKAFREMNVNVVLHSYNKSSGELELRDFIRSIGEFCDSIKFDKRYEIDCFVASKSFGVEYCGEFWHSYDPLKNNKNYHRDKEQFCFDRQIRLMTIFETEWNTKRKIVESMIRSRIGISQRLYARQLILKEVPSHVAIEFHDKNHMSGGIRASINIGLYDDSNVLYSVLSIVKSRFDRTFQYEIARYSTTLDHTVVGGLSKMMTHFKRVYDPESIMTYADLRFGHGDCYAKIGFEFVGKTVPNYFYIKKGSDEFESRMKYQKAKLKDMPGYSIDKTEYQIMTENKYLRIYDCGNNKYEWRKK